MAKTAKPPQELASQELASQLRKVAVKKNSTINYSALRNEARAVLAARKFSRSDIERASATVGKRLQGNWDGMARNARDRAWGCHSCGIPRGIGCSKCCPYRDNSSHCQDCEGAMPSETN